MVLSGQLRAPAALNPGKMPQYPRGRKLGGPQSRSGALWRRENPLAVPIVQLTTYSLYRLSYLGSFRLPTNATFLEYYKPSTPFTRVFKTTLQFPSCLLRRNVILATLRCQTLLYKTVPNRRLNTCYSVCASNYVTTGMS